MQYVLNEVQILDSFLLVKGKHSKDYLQAVFFSTTS